MKHAVWVVVAVLLASFGHASAASDAAQCARMKRRYERECAQPTPTPVPTASPKPSPQPMPCDGVLKLDAQGNGSVVKDYADGQERMLCFDVASPGPFNVTVELTNQGNASCAQMQSTLVSPTGQTYDNLATQPVSVLPRVAGRWYYWTKLIWANPGKCHTYTITVR